MNTRVGTSVFVDTNVFVYARDASQPAKQPAAARWVDVLWSAGAGRTSTQVLSEYYVTVTSKLTPGLSTLAARDDVEDLGAWKPLAVDERLIGSAWSIEDRYGLSWWDSPVVAAADHLGCAYLLTEDLQDGQTIEGTTVVDPFRHEPRDLFGDTF